MRDMLASDPHPRPSDQELAEGFADGDTEAFTELWMRHSKKFANAALRFCGNNERSAEEALSQFHLDLTLAFHRGAYRPQHDVTWLSWAYVVLHNSCRLVFRRQRRPPYRLLRAALKALANEGAPQRVVERLESRLVGANYWDQGDLDDALAEILPEADLDTFGDAIRLHARQPTKTHAQFEDGAEEFLAVARRETSPEEGAFLADLGRALEACLIALPPEKREMIKLRFYDGLKYVAIAQEVAGRNDASYASGRISRAMVQLKDCLIHKGYSREDCSDR